MIINFEGLREQLTDEQVKDILLQYNVEPCVENADTIIFPTCCHNLTGGSPKLYYYKDSKGSTAIPNVIAVLIYSIC